MNRISGISTALFVAVLCCGATAHAGAPNAAACAHGASAAGEADQIGAHRTGGEADQIGSQKAAGEADQIGARRIAGETDRGQPNVVATGEKLAVAANRSGGEANPVYPTRTTQFVGADGCAVN